MKQYYFMRIKPLIFRKGKMMRAGKKTKNPSHWKLRWMIRGISGTLLILLGGVLFNLDRLDAVGIRLMRHRKLLPPQIRMFLPGASAQESRAAVSEVLSGKIIAVYDGDTATLLAPDGEKKYKLRFFGIDAPESAQEYGKKSENALSQMILGREVRAEVMNIDPYGRAVAKVYADAFYVNLAMVGGGHAWYYAAYAPHEKELETAQQKARYERRGLWSGPPPQPPWEYRKEHK